MRSTLSLGVAITVSLLLHAAVLLVKRPVPALGKNIPAMTHPARVRLMGVRQVPSAPPVAPAPDAVSVIAPPQAAPTVTPPVQPVPAAAPEGRIDVEPTNFVESSARYFSRDELDERPVVLDPPDLGAMELSPLLEGRAILVFYLDEYGGVDRIEVEESTLPPSMLDQLRAQQEQIKFSPGNINGVDVKSVARFEIALAKQATTTELARDRPP